MTCLVAPSPPPHHWKIVFQLIAATLQGATLTDGKVFVGVETDSAYRWVKAHFEGQMVPAGEASFEVPIRWKCKAAGNKAALSLRVCWVISRCVKGLFEVTKRCRLKIKIFWFYSVLKAVNSPGCNGFGLCLTKSSQRNATLIGDRQHKAFLNKCIFQHALFSKPTFQIVHRNKGFGSQRWKDTPVLIFNLNLCSFILLLDFLPLRVVNVGLVSNKGWTRGKAPCSCTSCC